MQTREEYLEIILKMLKDGRTYSSIAKELKMGESTISFYKSELIKRKRITQAELDEIRKRRREEKKKEKKQISEEKEETQEEKRLKEKVLKELKLGLIASKIIKKLDISGVTFNEIRKELIRKGMITKEEIELTQQNRKKADKEKVYALCLKGYYYEEIMQEIEEARYDYIEKLVNELIQEGRITSQEIKELSKKRHKETKKKFVLKGLRKGESYSEIATNYITKYGKPMDKSMVGFYKEKLVREGAISEDEIMIAKNDRARNKTKVNRGESEKQSNEDYILRLFYFGFTKEEIRTIIGEDIENVNEIERRLIKKRKITKARIKGAYQSRDKMSEKMREKVTLIVDFNEDIDTECIQEYIEYLKAKMELGNLGNADIRLLSRVLLMDAEFITLSNVSMVITYFTRKREHAKAVEFIDECMDTLEHTDNRQIVLRVAKQTIEENIERRRRIMRMAENMEKNGTEATESNKTTIQTKGQISHELNDDEER